MSNGLKSVKSLYSEEGLKNIAMVTLAPEIPGAIKTISELVERGIVVSVGKIYFFYKFFFLKIFKDDFFL